MHRTVPDSKTTVAPKGRGNPCDYVTSAVSYLQSCLSSAFFSKDPFAHLPHLPTRPCEQWSHLKKRGGFATVVNQAAKLAERHPLKMCVFKLVLKPVLLIEQPHHIAQLLDRSNAANVSRAPLLEAFGEIYGHNLLSMPSNDEWRELRAEVMMYLKSQGELAKAAPEMQRIIDGIITNLPKSQFKIPDPIPKFLQQTKKPADKKEEKEHVVELEGFLTNITMNVMAQSRFGTGKISGKSSQELSHILSESLIEAADTRKQLSMLKLKFLRLFYKRKKLATFQKMKDQLHEVYLRELIEKNDQEIRETENLLKTLARREQPGKVDAELKFDTESMKDQGTFLLLGGHETTTRLLQFCLMFLVNNLDVLDKLLDEIEKFEPKDGQWTKEILDQMPYIQMVLSETLRHYSPAGISARQVLNECVLKDIDGKKIDVRIPAGTIVAFSPFLTHNLKEIYREPEKFIPERFKNPPPAGAFFPFSLGERECVGKDFALQEAKMILCMLLKSFKLKDITYENGERVKHPVELVIQGTIRAKERMKIHLVPRKGFKDREIHDLQASVSHQHAAQCR